MLQKQTTEELQSMVQYVSDKPILPAYAWPGGYPIVYMAEDCETVCSECANGGNGAEFQNPEYQEDKDWILSGFFIHYEGQPVYCAHCNCTTESAYGDPEEVMEDY